jgi:hypothetical protein
MSDHERNAGLQQPDYSRLAAAPAAFQSPDYFKMAATAAAAAFQPPVDVGGMPPAVHSRLTELAPGVSGGGAEEVAGLLHLANQRVYAAVLEADSRRQGSGK